MPKDDLCIFVLKDCSFIAKVEWKKRKPKKSYLSVLKDDIIHFIFFLLVIWNILKKTKELWHCYGSAYNK